VARAVPIAPGIAIEAGRPPRSLWGDAWRQFRHHRLSRAYLFPECLWEIARPATASQAGDSIHRGKPDN